MESCCVMRRLPDDGQVCSSKQASAAQQSSMRRCPPLPPSHPSCLPSSVPFLFPRCPLPASRFHSSPQLRPRGGLDTSDRQARIQIQDRRPGAGDLSVSGRQTAAGVSGRAEADEALSGTLLVWRRGRERRKGQGGWGGEVESSLSGRWRMVG